MFTGIVESIGSVVKHVKGALDLTVGLPDINLGDSVSVNGVCLTVSSVPDRSKKAILRFDVSEESYSRTTIAALKKGDMVNIERAVKPSSRLGGHIVTGHIDCTGVISSIHTAGNSKIFGISCPKNYLRYIVEKGSVAVDGVGLTIMKKEVLGFSAAVIPHTYANTNFHLKKKGMRVNIETDIIGKYVLNEKSVGAVTLSTLEKAGFL
ncbi:MAG: Riboflavin synthase [Elusimicrobia bacterium ADurb.Bin231]|nr:MAG: Riboflavin synthase [Elusimicrobia bacterium ADurb.Bin231]